MRRHAARALAVGAGTLFAAVTLGARPLAPEKIARALAEQDGTARADWWGFDAADATASLQAALTSGVRRLTIPNMGTPWIVHPLFLPSDLEITLEPGTVIEAIRGGFKGRNDSLFTALGQSNLVIRGPGATLRMHKRDYQDTNLYARAEWRHTLTLLSCENVRVEGLTLKSSGGVAEIIARGHPEQVRKTLQTLNPLLCESVPLTLEEIFITEMEAVGYDFNNVLF